MFHDFFHYSGFRNRFGHAQYSSIMKDYQYDSASKILTIGYSKFPSPAFCIYKILFSFYTKFCIIAYLLKRQYFRFHNINFNNDLLVKHLTWTKLKLTIEFRHTNSFHKEVIWMTAKAKAELSNLTSNPDFVCYNLK